MSRRGPMLYIFSGLPGSGKTTLARRLSAHLGAVYLRIDTIEQGLRDLCSVSVQGEGYELAYRLAVDNLKLKSDVVVDSCNPVQVTRDQWHQVAVRGGAGWVDLEIACSEPQEHRSRLLTRVSDIAGLSGPSWADVQAREYHPWVSERLLIDTASHTVGESFEALLSALTVCTPRDVG